MVPDRGGLRENEKAYQRPGHHVQPSPSPHPDDIQAPNNAQQAGRDRFAKESGNRLGVGELNRLRPPVVYQELGGSIGGNEDQADE